MGIQRKQERTENGVWWVNYTLSDEELTGVDDFETTDKFLVDGCAELVDDGYRITFGLDTRSSATLVCFFSPSDHKYHPNQALSSRSPDMAEALKINLFKHHEVFKAKWPTRAAKKTVMRG